MQLIPYDIKKKPEIKPPPVPEKPAPAPEIVPTPEKESPVHVPEIPVPPPEVPPGRETPAGDRNPAH